MGFPVRYTSVYIQLHLYRMYVAQSTVRGTVEIELPLGAHDWSIILTW